MPACASRLPDRRRFWAALLLFGCLALPARAAEHDFVIKSIETALEDGVYRLNARIDYRFSEAALNALRNGVPLLIQLDIQVREQRWYWDRTLAELQQGYLLLYHALSGTFIIHNLNSGTQDHYRNLDTALEALGHVRNLPLIDAKLLAPDKDYAVRLRAHLDIESLPAPMRPMAYISADWDLDSGWYTWPLTR